MGIVFHDKFGNSLDPGSVWATVTPSNIASSLPFYIMEAGLFLANRSYRLSRDYHSSYLLLCTEQGRGMVRSQGTSVELLPGSCIIIDCRQPHEYYGLTDLWKFRWIHMEGSGIPPLFALLYPAHVRSITPPDPVACSQLLQDLFALVESDDVLSSVRISSRLHQLFATLLEARLAAPRNRTSDGCSQEIASAVEFIRNNFQRAITIDQIIADLPISKYHFIRSFRRIMGMPPYSYLTSYRINMAKVMLCTTEMSIAEIAEACGFLEASNFISHFKKNTGMRPTEYRKFF